MRRTHFIIIGIMIAAIACWAYYFRQSDWSDQVMGEGLSRAENAVNDGAAEPSRMEVVAQDLDIPWEIVFLPEGDILVTERSGRLRKLGADGFAMQVPGVAHIGEGGLLGLALHPDYASNHWIFVYHTVGTESGTTNVVERYTLSGSELLERRVILENIPGSANHNGGRIKFGPDGFLYVTTGDAQNGASAQDVNSLAGKILRLKEDGTVPEDNPFGNPVYSYGHRNVQGLDWDNKNKLWATEHGRSGVLSGYDELNRIEKGKNYGWPDIQGDESRPGMESPVVNSGASDTWAPSGTAYRNGSIFFAGLRGQALYEYRIDGGQLATHFKGGFGRLRDVVVGPDSDLYLLTNNTDGRGAPRVGDDKIIRIGF